MAADLDPLMTFMRACVIGKGLKKSSIHQFIPLRELLKVTKQQMSSLSAKKGFQVGLPDIQVGKPGHPQKPFFFHLPSHHLCMLCWCAEIR